MDWLNGTLRVERGIVQQIVDDVKTDDSRKTLTIAADLLDVLKLVEANNSVLRAGGLDFRFARSDRQTAVVLHGCKAGVATRREAAGLGHLRHAHIPAHVPDVD